MKKLFILISAILTLCVVPTFSSAAGERAAANNTVVTVDLSKVTPDMAVQLLDMQKRADEAAKKAAEAGSIVTDIKEVTDGLDPVKLQEWTKATGNMIREVASSVGLSVNDFLKTPAGWGLAGIILWRTGGPFLVNKIISVVFGGGSWLLLTIIWVWVFYKLFFAKKKVVEEEKNASGGVVKNTHM